MNRLTPDFEAYLRTKINPIYADQRGTESYERAALLGEIDRLRAAIRKTLADNGHLADGPVCTLLALKRAIGIESCKKCGADMQDGVAIEQTFTGLPDFPGDKHPVTLSPGGKGKLIECKKCPECGYSQTK